MKFYKRLQENKTVDQDIRRTIKVDQVLVYIEIIKVNKNINPLHLNREENFEYQA